MLRGIGCEPDAQRAKAFFLDIFFRVNLDRSKALDLLDSCTEGSNEGVMAALREMIADEDALKIAKGYGRLILVKILDEDRDAVGRIFDKILADPRVDPVKVMIMTYTLLRSVTA